MFASKLLKCSVLALSAALVDPCLSSDDDLEFDQEKQARKKDQGWQVVTSRSQRIKNKPKVPQESLMPPGRKARAPAVKDRRTKEEIEKQAKLDAKWEKTRKHLLGEMETLKIPNAKTVVAPLLYRLRRETSLSMIQKHFKDYMFFMSSLPAMKKGAHVRAFRNIYANNSNYPNLMNTFLASLPEEDRLEHAPNIHQEALSVTFLQFKKGLLELFEKFNANDKLIVLQLIVNREKEKLLRNRTFSQAFHELMTMVKYDGEKARTFDDASAHLKIIRALSAKVDLAALNIDECKNRGLAWTFIWASEGVNIPERGFARQFNLVYDSYCKSTFKGSSGNEIGLLKNDLPLFIQVLKMVLAERLEEREIWGQSNKFASIVFANRSEQTPQLLECMHTHRNLWYKKPIARQYTLDCETFYRASAQTQMPLTAETLFVLLNKIAVDWELDPAHWEDVIKDIAMLSEKTEDLIDHFSERLEAIRSIPSDIRKQIAFDFWKMYVAEQLLVGRDAEENRRGLFSYQKKSRFSYTIKLLEFLTIFPRDEMLKIFQVMQKLLPKVSADGSAYNEFIKDALSDIRELQPERRSDVLETFEKFCSRYTVSATALRDYLKYTPYLKNDEWLSSLLKYPSVNKAYVLRTLLVWHASLDSVTQEEVHAFWKGELLKPDRNEKLACKITEHANELPSTLRDLLTAAAFSIRQKYMSRMNSSVLSEAKYAAEHVINNDRKFGIIDRDNDEVYQMAKGVIQKALLSQRDEFMAAMNSYDYRIARGAAKQVIENPNKFGVFDPDTDEVHQLAKLTLEKNVLRKRQKFMTQMNSDDFSEAHTAAEKVIGNLEKFGITDPDTDEVHQLAKLTLEKNVLRERQKFMTQMHSDDFIAALTAAKKVIGNLAEFGITDPVNDELHKQANLILERAVFYKRQEFMTIMNSDDLEAARNAAEQVIDHPRRFGIIDPDSDEVHQFAIIILVRTEDSTDPLNPYNVLKHHQTMAEEVVNHEAIRTPSVKPINSEDSYYVRGDVFNFMRVNQVTYAQLPKHSKTFIRDMMKQVLAKDPELNSIMLGASLGGFLEHLLSTTGDAKDLTPVGNAKLIAIVAYLQSLANEAKAGDKLTQQELEFVRFMSHAQACETNKTEVIHKFYVSLPEEARLKRLKSAEDSSEDHLRQIFEMPLWDLAEEIFSSEKPFLRTLCGLSKGEIFPNASHIEMFVKNLLLRDVPFYTRHAHDPYTSQCVPDSLLTYRRTGVLELLFSKFIKVEDLANEAETAINRQMIMPKSPTIVRVQEFFESKGRKAELEFDDETQITILPKHKVYELLHLLNILQVEGK